MNPRIIDTDVVVIGGGAAGARAAWECAKDDLAVTLVVKGALGKSGCSIFAGNLSWFSDADVKDKASPESMKQRIEGTMAFLTKYTHYLGDQEYFEEAAKFNHEEFYPWLERRGLAFMRREDGSIVSDLPRGTQTWITKMGASGQQVMNLMRQMVQQSGVNLMEHTTATAIISGSDGVQGVVVLEYVTGTIYFVRAKAVILATGHNNYLATRSTGTREGAANGWAIAYRAGVPLQNLEIQWYHASDIASPPSWMRLHLYPNPLPNTDKRSHLVNEKGETFFSSEDHITNPVPYILQMKALIRRAMRDGSRFDGGYFTDYRHVEPEVMHNYVAPTSFMTKLGLDPTNDLVESGATWHMNVGGISVDHRTMGTSLPGLYAAGSVNALVTGGLPNVTYDGIVAAAAARDHCRRTPEDRPTDEATVHREVQRLEALRRPHSDSGTTPAEVKRSIRHVMWTYCGPIKDEEGLSAGVAALRDIRRDAVPRMGCRSDAAAFSYEWVEAIDVLDMLDVCELVLKFSLAREESRGSFFRRDYPLTDNRSWLRHSIGVKRGESLHLTHEPVKLPFFSPEELEPTDFFTLDY